MDGASTDDTVAVLQRSAWNGLRWRSEPDLGQSDALNKALAESSGDIIGWLNADEWYLEGVAEQVRARFIEDPGLDVLYGEFYMVDLMRRFVRSVPSHRFSSFVLQRYGCFVPSCATFIRRSALAETPWRTELRWIMDWDLWLNLTQSGARFRHVRTPFSAFTLHPNQVTSGDPAPRAHEWSEVQERWGIPAGARAGLSGRLGRAAHATLKLGDGGYFRQWSARRRLGGSLINVPALQPE